MDSAKKHTNLLPLLAQLSNEPVITEFNLANHPLRGLANEIEQVDWKIDARSTDENYRDRLKASAERCRNTFALLLSEVPPAALEEVQSSSIEQMLAGIIPIAATPVSLHTSSLTLVQTPVQAPIAEIQAPVQETRPEPAPVSNPAPKGSALGAESTLSIQWMEFANALVHGNLEKLPGQHVTRLVLQHLILALENEAQEKLSKGLVRIWPQRKTALLQYLDPKTQAVSSAVQSFLKELETAHPEWIRPFEISTGWLQVMLRYWLSENPAETFRPSLAECGFILCLFGQNGVSGLAATNLLGMEGLNALQVQELVVRLNRLHRYRNLLFSIRENLTAEGGASIREDLESCFRLLQKIQLASSGADRG